MAKREFTFRGKTLPELLEMELKQFSEIAGSRIRRSISRGLNEKVLKRVQRANEEKRAGKEPRIIRTQSRDFPVLIRAVSEILISVIWGIWATWETSVIFLANFLRGEEWVKVNVAGEIFQ